MIQQQEERTRALLQRLSILQGANVVSGSPINQDQETPTPQGWTIPTQAVKVPTPDDDDLEMY